MDSLLSRVRCVIDELDPEGLRTLGAPSDEYLPEAEEFAERLERGEVLTPDAVTEIWVAWFYPACGLVKKQLAGQLANNLNGVVGPSPRPR